MMSEDEYITPKQLADELNITKQSVFNHIKKLPSNLVVKKDKKGYHLSPEIAQYISDEVVNKRALASGKAEGKISVNLPARQFPSDPQTKVLQKQIAKNDKLVGQLLDSLEQERQFNRATARTIDEQQATISEQQQTINKQIDDMNKLNRELSELKDHKIAELSEKPKKHGFWSWFSK